MQLEEYFEFEQFETGERIRVKGTRIAIEHILEPYLEGVSPEMIVHDYYPSLTLEQVYAALTYYLHNQVRVDDYLRREREEEEAVYQQYLRQEPSPVVKRLRALKAQQHATGEGA